MPPFVGRPLLTASRPRQGINSAQTGDPSELGGGMATIGPGTGQLSAGASFELTVIAAVIIGGTSMYGEG